jgi:hypothetical protein
MRYKPKSTAALQSDLTLSYVIAPKCFYVCDERVVFTRPRPGADVRPIENAQGSSPPRRFEAVGPFLQLCVAFGFIRRVSAPSLR